MSEKEIKNSMRKESKEEYCHSLSHKPWFWGATAGAVVLLAVIGIVIWLFIRKKNEQTHSSTNK
jgi:cytochrome b subunit of formate dehydrogenase